MKEYEMIWCNGSSKWIPSYLCEDGLNCEECEYFLKCEEDENEKSN